MAMSAAEIIRKANDAARVSWGIYTTAQLADLITVFEASSNAIKARLLAVTSKDVIPYMRLQLLGNQIENELTLLYKYLNSFIEKETKDAINAAIHNSVNVLQPVVGDLAHVGTSYKDKAGILRYWDSKEQIYSASVWAQLNKDALDHFMRFRPQGLILSQEVWNVTWEAQKNVMRRIGEAIVIGEKVSSLATAIESLLGAAPGQKADILTGDLIHPGKGVYKSMYANTVRLARTELSRAYVEGQHRYNSSKEWIIGAYHRVGGDNPCETCTALNGTFYPKGEYTEIPVHPNCECYEEPVLSEEWTK